MAREGGVENGAIVHCFTGTVDDARAWLDLGCHLSFSGILTFKSADEIRRAAAFAPEDRILVETDCPFLAPLPYRGKRNEPAWVVETAKVLAAVRGVSLEQTAAATVANTRAAFRIPVGQGQKA
jgi:TatD DNase family protein